MAEQSTQDNERNLSEKLSEALNNLSRKIVQDIEEENQSRFVFNDAVSIQFDEDIHYKLEKLRSEIEKLGYKIEVLEDLDIENVSNKTKYSIRIENLDKCYTEISLFDYRNIMLTYGESEEEFIENELVKISGIGQRDLTTVSKLICEYLSYACFFKEVQTKLFSKIGWATYDNQRVFMYDRIYDNNALYGVAEASDESEEHIEYHIKSINTDPFSEAYTCSKEYVDYKPGEFRESEEMIHWIIKLFSVMSYDSSQIDSKKVERKPYNSLITAAACTGLIRPLLSYTKENNINMNIVGDRASGKSTICHFVLSLFGNPEKLEGSFLDSEEAIEVIRAKRPVVPYILDERMLRVEDESEKAKKKKILMDIFREYEGKVKERMAGSAKSLSGERTYAPIISSSVEPMLNLLLQTNRDLGQYRRFIEINIKKGDLTSDSENAQFIEKTAYSEYGYGVKMIVTYILEGNVNIEEEYSRVAEEVNTVLKEREKKERELEEQKKGRASVIDLQSSASRFALILTTLGIIQDAMKYNIIKGIELINKGIGNGNTETEKTLNVLKEILCSNLINKEKDVVLTPNQEDVLKLLTDNLVDKMKRVNLKINVYDNIQKFIRLHEDLFADNQANYGNNPGQYIAYKSVDKETGDITIGFRKDRGLEWIMSSLFETMSRDEIVNYIANVNAKNNKALCDETMSKTLGDLKSKSLESVMTAKDKRRIQIEFKDNLTSVKNGMILTLKNDEINIEEDKESK